MAGVGHFHGHEVAHTQPTKMAAMESLWETTKDAPMYLLLIPDPANEKNSVEAIGIPSMLSILAGQKEVKGLKVFFSVRKTSCNINIYKFQIDGGTGVSFHYYFFMGFF